MEKIVSVIGKSRFCFTWSGPKLFDWRDVLTEIRTPLWEFFSDRSLLYSWFLPSFFQKVSRVTQDCNGICEFEWNSSTIDRTTRFRLSALLNSWDNILQSYVFFLKFALRSARSLWEYFCPQMGCFWDNSHDCLYWRVLISSVVLTLPFRNGNLNGYLSKPL